MAFEVHGGAEDADDLQGIVVHSKENGVAAFGGDAAAGNGRHIERPTSNVERRGGPLRECAEGIHAALGGA